MPTLPTVAVIGAGSSGIAAAKALHERGVPFTCFEASDRVGGNWVFGNKNGMSAAYRQLFINTSRDRMEYSDYPMPKSYPDFPHHTQIAAYFDAYVEHFGFRDRIRFETKVARAQRLAGGGWELTLDDGSVERFDALLVANGHHWDPRWPEPMFPGHESFTGRQLHAHAYLDNDLFADKDVVVLGMGNSAMDIAVEASYVARSTYLAARRGAWIIPKYMFGRPVDQLPQDPRVPFKVRQRVIHALIKLHVGNPERYGLPAPDHKFGEAHPTVSGRILDRIAHGTITPKPNIRRLRRRRGRVRRRLARARRRGRLLHGLQDQLPVLRRGPHLGPREPHRALPARLPPGVRRRVLRRPAAAAGGHHAAGRGPGAVDRRLPQGRVRAAAAARAAAGHRGRDRPPCASATSPPSAIRSRSTSTTTCTRWARSAARAPSARAGRASGCRCPRPGAARAQVRSMSAAAGASASASAPRRPIARRSSSPRGACSATSATGPRRCATSCESTDLATGTFYNYFPDKESVLRALVDEIAVEARRACARARMGAHDARGVRPRRLSRLLRVPRRGPDDVRAHAPQRGDDPHDVRRARPGRGHQRAARRPRDGGHAGRIPPHDADLMAVAMVGAGVEIGVQMVERDPPDVERA